MSATELDKSPKEDGSDDEGGRQAELTDPAFGKRLRAALAAKGLKPAELARLTGLTRQRVSDYAAGRKVPRADTMLSIADALSVSARWLIREEGPQSPDREYVDDEEYVLVPHYDLFAFESAAPPTSLEKVPLPRGWLLNHARTTDVWVTEMPNDAMPRTAPQSTMIVLRSPGDRLQDRKIYAFLWDGRPLIRGVEFKPEGLALVAENPDIDPIVPSAEQLDRLIPIGQVVGSHLRPA